MSGVLGVDPLNTVCALPIHSGPTAGKKSGGGGGVERGAVAAAADTAVGSGVVLCRVVVISVM